ncbi:uncharacterized protein LOC124695190 isoform X1 [Lolium rigidum]|uniref:uncharacterized protein LOC124687862 isoform X2 n=1 Tax=Lolium rigidum TaxID=89674 RepID=UPI001F5C8947|nr:uncharacterized protein LOC124687862 isoform X2 [Lolium rigidum]XP_047084026.1 uncharacterized protein LOC124695190 isoform X1 [Lolium rigidum]
MTNIINVLPVRTRSFNITIEGLMAFRYEVFQLIGLASTSNRFTSVGADSAWSFNGVHTPGNKELSHVVAIKIMTQQYSVYMYLQAELVRQYCHTWYVQASQFDRRKRGDFFRIPAFGAASLTCWRPIRSFISDNNNNVD